MRLKSNQAAIILEADDYGEISVTVAAEDHNGLPARFCQAIAHKLANDVTFQEELLDILDED